MTEITEHTFRRLKTLHAEERRNFVAWIGSGLSARAGIPTWPELITFLSQAANHKLEFIPDKSEREKTRSLISISKHSHDSWEKIEYLKKALGAPDFESVVKSAIEKQESFPTPEIYRKVWRLNIDGIISLNIDDFAERAFVEIYRRPLETIENSNHIGAKASIFRNPSHFLLYLHGKISSPSGWVFTKPDLDMLMGNTAYIDTIKSLVMTKTIIFLGMSADDVAVGSHLTRIKQNGIDVSDHFWITSRSDREANEWAKSSGVQIINYTDNDKKDRHYGVDIILDELVNFRSSEVIPRPIQSHIAPIDAEPPQNFLLSLSPEVARKKISAYFNHILLKHEPETAKKIIDSYKEINLAAVNHASLIHTSDPYNVLFGYKIESEIGGGAFGKVYLSSRNGERYAIKILRSDAQNDKRMVDSFRRGAQSLKIINDEKLNGIVSFVEAFDLPPCIIMEYIDGMTLEDAILSRKIESASDIIKIFHNITTIIRRAHGIDAFVLHRDMRPSNVMIERSQDSDLKIKILDFDLSWYRGADDSAIGQAMTTAFGYLAPEQMSSAEDERRRSTRVDVFGIGMVLYFMISKEIPLPNQSSSTEWIEKVDKSCKTRMGGEAWKSLPKIISSIIIKSTQPDQSKRMTMQNIEYESENCRNIISGNHSIDPDYFSQEIICRATDSLDFSFDPQKREAWTIRSNAVKISVKCEDIDSLKSYFCKVYISQYEQGSTKFESIKGFYTSKKRTIQAIFSNENWTCKELLASRDSLAYEASKKFLGADFDKEIVHSLKKICDVLRFD